MGKRFGMVFRKSVCQSARLSKESGRVRSATKRIPFAPEWYAGTNDLNILCPAMSHKESAIFAFSLRSSKVTSFTYKFTPMLGI
ncbi:MAG: hypothetical protein RBG13Loki_0195 [Promethearchaeota archaeon CR_4]|nr:MAG: hypothetical protein RBG13Loki_0195 [Candidatus Lokiarchaeota archaeon CR_4]